MSGLLGAVYSYGDSAKRKLRGLLQDPLGTIGLGVARFGEDQQQMLDLANEAGYMPGSRSVLVGDKQRALARALLAQKATDMGAGMMQAATVWHGSPHKFDKFDSSKIGTGEGAQAYGHGLYLAEAPDVARTYSADRAYVGAAMQGKPIPINYDDPAWIAQKTIDELGDPAKAKAHLEMVQRTAAKYQPAETRAAVQGAIDMIASGSVAPKGSLYKVDLPDEKIARMLDWDKPLSQQAPEVQKALNSINPAASKTAEQIAAAQKAYEDANYLWMSRPSGLPKDVEERLAKGAGQAYEDWQQMVGFGDKKGAYIYNQLARGKPYSAGSEALRQAGIPGIRYLDGGSRGAGAGTSNYVVFPGEEGALTILERNGQQIKALAEALRGAQ